MKRKSYRKGFFKKIKALQQYMRVAEDPFNEQEIESCKECVCNLTNHQLLPT